MDSLAAYGSDEEPRQARHHRAKRGHSNAGDVDRVQERGQLPNTRKEDDTNYDHVTMDMSEESNNNNSDDDSPCRDSFGRSSRSSGERDRSKRRLPLTDVEHYDDDPPSTSFIDNRKQNNHRNRDRDCDQRRYDKDITFKNDKEVSDRRDRDKNSDRDRRHEDRPRGHVRERHDRKYSNDDKRSHIDRRRERSSSRNKSSSGSKRRSSSGDGDKSGRGYNYRYSEESKRSGSREHRFKRSRSRDKSPASNLDYKPSYKVSKKLQAMDKMGLQIKTPDGSMATAQMLMRQTFAEKVEKVKNTTGIELPKYYNPAAMNPLKYANQIQKRKLLWGNRAKETTDAASSAAEGAADSKAKATSAGKWQGTKFAQDSDGRVASKFMRLMGVKDPEVAQSRPPSESPGGDLVKKQEEMFEAMQAQYEVARATTHTMRGVGLGFSSHNKPY